ncbi:MAG TPA: general secretion pathway protein GspB [Steroidobacteraceae bacterium]|nr:general secretion pathway protein GspB [Steroidobacteraceae bacterium]
MSFILDALKKSEIERQRQTEPGLMDAGSVQRRGRLPVWAVLLGLLLTINIAVLLIMLIRNGAPTVRSTPAARADASHAKAAPAAQTAAENPATFSPLDSSPVYAPEIPLAAATGSAAADSAPPATRPPVSYVAPLRTSAARAGARALRRPDPVLTDADAGADSGEILPSISEISLSGAQALPELHLDVHVYATDPADRFVYINMRKYHEGSVLQEGPRIELIRRDGVVLNFQGLRFLLPRQS